ncbi:MAG: MBL fold metallo-hydrolase [Thermoflexia bacterium]|nr:MAG: MBL fold metallo-hydrolase [Thermoflexia bacterium]
MFHTYPHGPVTRLKMARTLFGRPLYTVQAYLVDGLLIDTGCPGTAQELLAWCRNQAIRQVVNTHHHEDHSGGNYWLQRELGVPIAAPEEAIPILANFPRLEFYRRLTWGQPRNVQVEPLGPTVETNQYRFLVVPTPGHSPDHICLFEPREGWLFSGDLFIHERARYIRKGENAREILRSLKRVLELEPRRMFCAHTGVVEDATEAIRRKIAYWEDLAARAQGLLERGLFIPEIARHLLGPETTMTYLTGGHFSKANLIASLLAPDGGERE